MSKNKQQDPQQTLKVENYEFEPIKGYPMLNWKGKRPFTSTQYFPAQLKESYGKPDANGWMNKIFWGDNLQVMSHLLKEYRGKVDLIYIDPPFDSNADYKMTIKIRNKEAKNDLLAFEEKQYSDIWSNDEYLQWMYDRLILLRELLSDKGTIYFHINSDKSHHIRCLMDEVFVNFQAQIIWQKLTATKSQSAHISNVHDLILAYSKTTRPTFNPIYVPKDPKLLETHYRHVDEKNGRRYNLADFTQKGSGPARKFGNRVIEPPPNKHWIWSQDKIDEGMENGLIVFSSSGKPYVKRYFDDGEGTRIGDIWTDINPVNQVAKERTPYPTQKPEALLERIITMSSNEDDLVLDAFAGSGTTAKVAMNMKRRFVGIDVNLGAIQTTTKRLSDLSESVGFQVYNVNSFDVFRNPVEAKEILLSAFEVSPIANSIFDGEKDGFMVKILPVNRIASKGDLNDLINGFDYKKFEKRQKESPNKAVEKILLICMGHEPDLKAHLEKEVNYKLDIEIVDILRDKQDLQFKRESEAKVKIKKDKLVIEKFYPMNLLQKLSLQKEKVSDWKELVESVLIDWNYDGAVLEPQVIDIPEKNELVAGEYGVPKDAGTIRVKITDLLSESIEIEVGRE